MQFNLYHCDAITRQNYGDSRASAKLRTKTKRDFFFYIFHVRICQFTFHKRILNKKKHKQTNNNENSRYERAKRTAAFTIKASLIEEIYDSRHLRTTIRLCFILRPPTFVIVCTLFIDCEYTHMYVCIYLRRDAIGATLMPMYTRRLGVYIVFDLLRVRRARYGARS